MARLRADRSVFIEGAPAGDVTEHAALGNSIRTTASLYDYQVDTANAEAMTFESPTSRHRVNRAWRMPESYRAC
ncbi:MAG: 4-hydroxyphenylacetate 3-hydroxylase N-terminal domain-containing protein [Pseudomonadota bacterium]|nr:4-hydroxyphenylacetate 3-hydroxylase N-terminal domain-containing protein [Pseudomonadota bacterium]